MSGVQPKDKEIVDGFNVDKMNAMSPKALRALERKVQVEKERLELDEKVEERRLLRLGLGGTVQVAPAGEVKEEAQGDDESAYQMLQDMRWVYRELKGREKLKKLVKGDDRQFVFMVKELMRIETALLAAKIRAKEEVGGRGGQMVFVVLKGLAEEEKVLKAMDNTIDMKQITNAMNPDGSEYVAKEKGS